MKRFESQVKQIPYSQEAVYAKVSDLSNLQSFINMIPEEKKDEFKVSDIACTPDSVSCSVSPVGQIAVGVVERQPSKCVKLETTKSPVKMTMWIQIVPTSDSSCKIKLTADADLNIFIAKMVEKPLADAIEKFASMLAMLPY